MLHRRRRSGAVVVLLVAALVAIVLVNHRSTTAGAPSITTSVAGTAGQRALDPDFSGFSVGGSAAKIADQRFAAPLKELRPGTLRGYPGGIGANYVNWQTGQGFTDGTGQDYIGPGVPEQAQKLSLFASMIKTSGATPVFTMNVMTYCPADPNDPQNTDEAAATCSRAQACGPDVAAYTQQCTNTDLTWGLPFQLKLLATAKSMGMPIKYVELGNEIYSGDPMYYFPTVQDYIAKSNVWIAAIKQAYPGVEVGVDGFAATNCVPHPLRQADVVARQDTWNPSVFSGIRDADAIIFHTYFQSGLKDGQSVSDPGAVSTMLSTAAQRCIENVTNRALRELPNGMKAWITEWNIYPTKGALDYGSWAQGLVEGLYATELARAPQVELMDNETLTSTQIFGAILGGTIGDSAAQQKIAVPDNPPPVDPFTLSAGGRALSLFNRAATGMTSTSELTFGVGPHITGTHKPGLYGQIFSDGSKKSTFLMNLSDTEVVLGLGPLKGRWDYETQSAEPDAFVVTKDATTTASGSADDRLTLPPYSVTALTSA